MKHHFARKVECCKKFQTEIGKSIVMVFEDEIPGSHPAPPSPVPSLSDDKSSTSVADVDMADHGFILGQTHLQSATAEEASPRQQSKHAQVEEVEDEDDVGRYTEEYPGHIATTLGMDKTKCEKIQDGQMMEGLEPHAPFTDEDEWELVKWLMKNVGQTKADDFLKMHIVRF
jgi:hypothetical protein